jgi:hypothetical protein
MSSKKDQHKTGISSKPRGQQTGFAGNPDQNREAKKETPALRGRRKAANKMFADESSHTKLQYAFNSSATGRRARR